MELISVEQGHVSPFKKLNNIDQALTLLRDTTINHKKDMEARMSELWQRNKDEECVLNEAGEFDSAPTVCHGLANYIRDKKVIKTEFPEGSRQFAYYERMLVTLYE